MNIVSIIIAKIILIIGKPLKKSSSLPGKIALKINSKLWYYFKLPKTIVAVTGSSGKGSTTKLIVDMLKNSGMSVATNKNGSNLHFAILTTLIENSNLKGEINKDAIVMEVDERYARIVFKYVKPNYVVITNITRDQPPRQGHYDIVSEKINEALNDEMHLILNGDDPYLQTFVKEKKVTYFGIEKNKYSYKENKFKNLNINYCPKCNSKLFYNYYNFENSGDFYCSKCKFKRPVIDVLGRNLDYEKNKIKVDEMTLPINDGILYSIYNTLAAVAVAKCLNIKEENIIKTLENAKNKKIFDIYSYKNRKITVLNNKNENSSTFNQSLLYTSRFKDSKVIVIGWKQISRRYNFDDLSWLYDIDFELLQDMDIEKIVCVGIHRFDIALRMKYSGIDEKKLVEFKNLVEATNYIKTKTSSNIYAILNFDYVEPFSKLMEGK